MSEKNLFDKNGSIFMGSIKDYNNSSIGIFGVNYDGTTCFKPGARFGPSAIRNVSEVLETYCPLLEKDLEDINYCDFGSLKVDMNETISIINKVEIATNYVVTKNLKPLVFGGEHSITTGIVKSLVNTFPNLVLIQLDAHADLREQYLNNRNSHACTMRRCLEVLPMGKIFQVGIRSGTRNEFKEMNNNNQLIKFNTGGDCNLFKNRMLSLKDFPIYLTIDLDWFDPSLVPGTGTPEPGGYFWHDFEKIIKILAEFNIVGADIVELSPDIDPTGSSSIVAAKAARSLIMTLDNQSQKKVV